MNCKITRTHFFSERPTFSGVIIFVYLFLTTSLYAQDPSAPTGLTISNETSTGFTLTWDADANATLGYNIFIVEPSADSGDIYITTVAAGTTNYEYAGTYQSITIREGGTYIAKIQALPDTNGNAFADTSVTIGGGAIVDPSAPMGLSISNATPASFTLSWDADQNATQGHNIFIVEPDNGSGDVYITTVPAGVNTFEYTGTHGSVTIEDGGNYVAKIQALPDGDGNAYADIDVDMMLLSIEDNYSSFSNTLMIYPNPTSDFVSIKSDKSELIKKLILTNINGQVIKTSVTPKLDLTDVSSGFYFVSVEDIKGTITTKKITKI